MQGYILNQNTIRKQLNQNIYLIKLVYQSQYPNIWRICWLVKYLTVTNKNRHQIQRNQHTFIKAILILNYNIKVMFNSSQPQNVPNPLQNQPQPQPLDNSPAAQFSFNNLVQKLEGVNQLQVNQQLQSLIIILKFLQDEAHQTVERVCLSRDFSNKNDASSHLSNVTRFKGIKSKNQELLIKVLNLREKMIHQMYMYKIRSPKVQNELDRLGEKIRHVRMRVNSKYTQLKYLKMANEENAFHRKKQEYNYSPLSVPLNDLKKGAQVIERESIRLREELNILIRHLHGEQI